LRAAKKPARLAGVKLIMVVSPGWEAIRGRGVGVSRSSSRRGRGRSRQPPDHQHGEHAAEQAAGDEGDADLQVAAAGQLEVAALEEGPRPSPDVLGSDLRHGQSSTTGTPLISTTSAKLYVQPASPRSVTWIPPTSTVNSGPHTEVMPTPVTSVAGPARSFTLSPTRSTTSLRLIGAGTDRSPTTRSSAPPSLQVPPAP